MKIGVQDVMKRQEGGRMRWMDKMVDIWSGVEDEGVNRQCEGEGIVEGRSWMEKMLRWRREKRV